MSEEQADYLHEQDTACLADFAWTALGSALKACQDTGMGPREINRLEIIRRMKALLERLDG